MCACLSLLKTTHVHNTQTPKGVPITMVPIEVTHQVLVTPRVRARILAGPASGVAAAAAGANGANGAAAPDATEAKASLSSSAATSAFRATANALLSFFEATYKELFFFDHAPLHDPVAVAAVIAPAIFKVLALLLFFAFSARADCFPSSPLP